MYQKINHQLALRKERQESTVRTTKKLLADLEAMPGVPAKVVGAQRAKLARQEGALLITLSEIETMKRLSGGDPAQKDLDQEIAQNEAEAAQQLTRARGRR